MERIDRRKAQVILIGGFLIAIGVLSAVLILNDISFSQTIASQNGNSADFGPTEFADDTEIAVSEAMTGNGTTPSNASDQFEEYLRSYSDSADEVLSDTAVTVDTSVDTTELTEAWMVGQRRKGEFTNATGEENWIMAENIEPSKNENIRGRFTFNVSGMNESAPDPDPFVLNATEEGTFDSLVPLTGTGQGWNLTAKINDTGSDQFLRLNMTEYEASLSGISINDRDEESYRVTSKSNVTVDIFDQTVDGDSSDFPDGTGVNPREANGFRFESGSEANGTYEFRFNGSLEKSDFDSSTGGPNGPCSYPVSEGGPTCRSADGTEKHIVGVVHNTTDDAVELEYSGRSTSYSKGIDAMTLDADDVDLNRTVNVDGGSYFDVSVVADNAPVVEDIGTVLEIEYNVENTGTESGTQDIILDIPGANPSNINNNTGLPLTAGGSFNSDFSGDNVTWDPDPGTNGTYTATVYSENSTTGERNVDTTQISVDKNTPSGSAPAIPDGPVGFALPSWTFEAVAETAGVTQR